MCNYSYMTTTEQATKTYRTLTTGGAPGENYQASSWDEASQKAEDAGYEVIDYRGPDTLIVAL